MNTYSVCNTDLKKKEIKIGGGMHRYVDVKKKKRNYFYISEE